MTPLDLEIFLEPNSHIFLNAVGNWEIVWQTFGNAHTNCLHCNIRGRYRVRSFQKHNRSIGQWNHDLIGSSHRVRSTPSI